jgi:hypothetical protein
MIRPPATALLLFALTACAAPRCRNQIARRVPAPDGSQDAVVYHRDCGAGEGASTEVALLPHDGDLPDLPTNVLTLGDSVDVGARWAGADSVVLTYPAPAKVVGRSERSPDGTTVAFRAQ